MAAERDNTEASGFILLVRLLATTGMRLGEALGLQWAECGFSRPSDPIARRQGRRPHRAPWRCGSDDPRYCHGTERSYVVHGSDPAAPLSAPSAEKAWARLRERLEWGQPAA